MPAAGVPRRAPLSFTQSVRLHGLPRAAASRHRSGVPFRMARGLSLQAMSKFPRGTCENAMRECASSPIPTGDRSLRAPSHALLVNKDSVRFSCARHGATHRAWPARPTQHGPLALLGPRWPRVLGGPARQIHCRHTAPSKRRRSSRRPPPFGFPGGLCAPLGVP